MRTHTSYLTLVALLAVTIGCGKKDDSPAKKTADPATPPPSAAPEVDVKALAANIGVAPGAFEPDEETGIEAVATATSGTLAVRRVGEEQFKDQSAEESEALVLYPGDQVRANAEASAEVKLADQTVIELAHESVVAIGDRDASADPASSAAVLYGVARFSVSQRGPGEGPFLVYTPGGVSGTKGTTYAVGVAVTGATRVGVEAGEIEVAGHADLANPRVLTANQAVGLTASGTLAATAEFTSDDWGVWRDDAEAEGTPAELVTVHTARIEALEPEVGAAYASLQELTLAVEQDDATAREMEEAGNLAGYEADAEPRMVALEASFNASLRLQGLTYAMLSHAYLADSLYARHPVEVEPVYLPARSHVSGAVLYHKKYHSIVRVHVKPMRPLYYRHHPRGLERAKLVSVDVPAFYLKAKLKAPPAEKVRARAGVAVYVPPVKFKVNAKKKVWVGVPPVGWAAKMTVEPRDHRGEGWYRRPAQPRARLVVGAKVVRPATPVFGKLEVVAPRGKVKVGWGAAGGVNVRAKRPQGNAGINVGVPERPAVRGKAGVKVGVPERQAVRGNEAVKVKLGADAKARGDAATKVIVKPPAGKVGVKVKGGVDVGAGVKKPAVKAPVVKPPVVKPPAVKGDVKVKAGAKGGIKIGGDKNR
ncbi:MAG TPA: FecR family protein [Kofleriaceae bacterium]|nr:FecR family protein [Kofleriaceae bacterium]